MMSHSSEENKTELKFIEFKPVFNSVTRDYMLMKRDSLFEVMSCIERQLKPFDLSFLFGEKNYPVFILPTKGCPTCLIQYLQLFSEYIDLFYEHNIQLVFSSSIALNFEKQFINLLELSQKYDNINIIGEDELGKILPVGLDRPVILHWKNSKAEKVRELEVGENKTIFEIIQLISR
ncbi:MAG: hypothetical protein JJU02_09290 [Cryomorphaceae bacterium]|nr:hypothetical protein [Cryomorphaceae bacterium]